MRPARLVLSQSVLALALLGSPGVSTAQPLPTPTCAWQFAFTPTGPGNWLLPDDGNRWWYMPIDPQWKTMTIAGTYPKARFFSLAVYDDAPVSTGLADSRYDANIVPDPGSVNPFATPHSRGHSRHRPQNYTMAVKRTDGSAVNTLRLHAATGWLIYRLYLPNEAMGSTAGVPLPDIHVTDAQGRTSVLPACPTVNRQSELATLQPQFIPPELENPPHTPPVPDRVWLAPIAEPPPRLLPNPDNKYLASFFMSDYDPDRVLVIRGKMPGFPDTYVGAPVSRPAPGFRAVEMRYWSMCLGSMVSPLPIEGCAFDAGTPLDESGFYTVMISNDALRPEWLPADAAWIPWGVEKLVPKTIFLRNLLPSPGFDHSAQVAIEKGCGITFDFPNFPDQDEITRQGQCAQGVMEDFYPVAVWCDRSVFRSGGWRACVRGN